MLANVIQFNPKLTSDTRTSSYDIALELDVAIRNTEIQQKKMLEQLKQIEELLAKQNTTQTFATWTIEPPRAYMPVWDAASLNWAFTTKNAVISQESPEIQKELPHLQTQTKSVPLHLLLEVGSLIVGAISIGSIAIWLSGHIPLLNPFASMLILLATPFFFSMGRIARNSNQ